MWSFVRSRLITIYIMIISMLRSSSSIINAEIIYFDRPGHYPFTVPPYNRLRVSLWGGGGTGMYVCMKVIALSPSDCYTRCDKI